MRVVFYARPWSVELHLALERHWREAGQPLDVRFVTHHVQVARLLRREGADVRFIPDELRSFDVDDPTGVLERFEEQYGDDLLPLARYLMSERFFAKRNRDWQVDQLVRHALFFESQLASFRPQILVGESPDIMPAWLAYSLAPRFGCEPVGLIPSTLPPGRLLLLRSHREIAGARELYALFCRDGLDETSRRAAEDLQAVVSGDGTRLDYLAPPREFIDLLKRIATSSVPRRFLSNSLWQLRERAASNWFVQPDPIVDQLRQPLRQIRARVADRMYMNDPTPSGPYVFYPLHYEPEATTLVHGSYFENQLELIRNLARSLPARWQLVVKEHFYMRGRRRLNVYRALRRIPNARLVPFSIPTNRLILDAEAVAVIASTVGLEAALVGKPVLMFGDYPWDYAPTVRKAGALADLPALIRHAPDFALDPDDSRVLAFAASWDAALPPGRYFKTRAYDWLEPKNVTAIATALETAARAGVRVPVDA